MSKNENEALKEKQTKEGAKEEPRPPSKAKIKKVLKVLSEIGLMPKTEFKKLCEENDIEMKTLFARDNRLITGIGTRHALKPKVASVKITKKGLSLLEPKKVNQK